MREKIVFASLPAWNGVYSTTDLGMRQFDLLRRWTGIATQNYTADMF